MQPSTPNQPTTTKKKYVKPSIVLEMKLDTSAGGTLPTVFPDAPFRPPWQVKP